MLGGMAMLQEQQTLGAPRALWGQREVREGSPKCRLSQTRDRQRLLGGGESPGHKHQSVKVWGREFGLGPPENTADSSKMGQEGKLFQGTGRGVWTFPCLLCRWYTRHIIDNL